MDDRLRGTSSMLGVVGVRLTSTLLWALLAGPVVASIPYTPTHLLYSVQHDGPTAYSLRPSDSRPDAVQFLSLNVSGNINPKDPEYTILLEGTPWRSDSQSNAFVPVIDQHGVVKVYAGGCQTGDDQLWRFTPDTNSSVGNGTWEKFDVDQTNDNGTLYGPNFLSAGFAYAPSNASDSSVFAFGGMCPFATEIGSTWMAAANYSQSTIVLERPSDHRSYELSTTGDRAPPIPEAGFAVVPMQATYGRSANGDMLQQQDFLLIGGHTASAFLNMSQLAVFSLPQNSWSFVSVESRRMGSTELAVRDTAPIEPRSGHTAVLSPDGSQVIVFGGWVGNTSVPATPQLAILNLGAAYSGYGEWTWSTPSMEGSGMAEGTGIYGHGATMLPGGMMMVSGGYSTAVASKRSGASPQANSQVYLYNVTSGSWSSSYTNPKTPAPDTEGGSSSSSSTSRKAGLGVGLGAGIPIVAGSAFFIWFYYRRRRVRQSRDKELRKLALGAERDHFWGMEEPFQASSIRRPQMAETDSANDYPWSNNHSTRDSRTLPPHWQETGDANAEQTHLLVDVPSPTKSSRPGLTARAYRPPAPYNEYRRSDATGDIHPIDEREEDEIHESETQELHDPFRDSAAAPSPVVAFASGIRMVGEHDDDDHDDHRTSSNLSDSSASSRPSRGGASGYHSISGRSSPEKPPSTYSNREPRVRPDSATLPHEKRYSSDSYSTAQTTLSQRQAEGEHLLAEPSPATTTTDTNTNTSTTSSSLATSDIFSRPLTLPRPRAPEWIGSVRRVLSVSRRRPAITDASDIAASSTAISALTSGADPTPGAGSGHIPRRSVSASAELFRRKQGARDWGAGGRSTRDDFALDGLDELDYPSIGDRAIRNGGGNGSVDGEEGEDWDVEGAAEGRRVQVTFTVPREKLRVVNATADDFSERSVSFG